MTARSEGRPKTSGRPRVGGRPRASDEDEWMLHANCRGMGDKLFPEAAAQRSARSICAKCPVRRECLAVALDDRIEWGVWGGMTERERRALLRERPGVKSWWAAFGLGTMKSVRAVPPRSGPPPATPTSRPARAVPLSIAGVGVERRPGPGRPPAPGAARRAARQEHRQEHR